MEKQPKAPEKPSFVKKLEERYLSLERIVAALTASVLLAYVYQLLSHGNFTDLSSYYNSISFAGFFVIMILGFAVLAGLTYLFQQRYIIPWALMCTALMVSVLFAANLSGMG